MNEIIELILNALRSQTFAIFGSLASIIGLILTIYVFLDVRRIKSYYVFAARVPELIEKLQQIALDLSDYWDDFEQNVLKIEMALARSEVLLESLKNKLDGEAKKAVARLLQDIKRYENIRKNKKGLWKIILNMNKIIEQVKEIQQDRQWEV